MYVYGLENILNSGGPKITPSRLSVSSTWYVWCVHTGISVSDVALRKFSRRRLVAGFLWSTFRLTRRPFFWFMITDFHTCFEEGAEVRQECGIVRFTHQSVQRPAERVRGRLLLWLRSGRMSDQQCCFSYTTLRRSRWRVG